MKISGALLLAILFVCAIPAAAGDIKNGEDLLRAMHDKYTGKWYKTLTFTQKTIHYKPDGTSTSEMWSEAMTVPGSLRIDFLESKTGDGVLFTDGQIYVYRDGKPATGRPFVHPLLVLGFDVYSQPVEKTIRQVKDMGLDVSIIHKEKWQGREMYVVGAKQGDLKSPQVWVDKDRLVFTRLFQLAGKDKKGVQETQFNKYVKATKGRGWVAAEVQFYVDGVHNTGEEYSDIRTDIALDSGLWDPARWSTADRSYYKKK